MQALMEGSTSDVHNILSSPDYEDYAPALLAAQRIDPLEVRHWLDLFMRYNVALEEIRTPSIPIAEQTKRGQRGNSTLLLELIRRGHTEAAMRVWDYYDERGVDIDVNEADSDGRSLMFYACYRWRRNDRSTFLLRLLRAGAEVSVRDYEGVTPLITACRAGNLTACLMLFNQNTSYSTDEGYNWARDPAYEGYAMTAVNEADASGLTPLWYAVLSENVMICDFLLKMGASVNQVCYRGRTALHLAVRISKHKKLDIFRVLMGLGKANPLLRDEKGNTAFDYAVMKVFY